MSFVILWLRLGDALVVCFHGYKCGAHPPDPAHTVDQVLHLGKYPDSSTIGLELGTPEASILSVRSRPSSPGPPCSLLDPANSAFFAKTWTLCPVS